MFTNRNSVNILTAAMVQRQVPVVVCPGSRNAPLVHNFAEAGLVCWPVTDERSAGFYALGIALKLQRPTAVCVTSGSALLNVLPAVAEAHYRGIPLMVISADRPAERIEQLAGQTIPQVNALEPFVDKSVNLPADDSRYCLRLVNEAFIAAEDGSVDNPQRHPVHINVPIPKPLHEFAVEALPIDQPIIKQYTPSFDYGHIALDIAGKMEAAQRPMIVVGQMRMQKCFGTIVGQLSKQVPVLYESLSGPYGGVPFQQVLESGDVPEAPDFVLRLGGTFVSNTLIDYLTKAPDCQTWAVTADGQVRDTFKNLTLAIQGDGLRILEALNKVLQLSDRRYAGLWRQKLEDQRQIISRQTPDNLSARAVKSLESHLSDCDIVHYANSMAIRYGNMYSRHYNYVNRGVNGIEGSLSTAAGHSLAVDERVVCVIGDLSFFYDSNALWQGDLRGNLRILLLNNGGGKIFETLPGMPNDARHRQLVMGQHRATAQGICQSYDVKYLAADSTNYADKIQELLTTPSSRPVVLEIMKN